MTTKRPNTLPKAKTCTRCGILKPLADFAVSSAKKDGRKAHCKACGTKLTRQWVEKNPEKKKALDRQWRLANPDKERERLKKYAKENKAALQAYHKAYYAAHKEEASEKSKARYFANPEKYRERAKAYYRANPDKWQKAAMKYRAANKEKLRKLSLEWARANPEKRKEISLRWYKANRPKRRAYVNKRLANDPIFKMHASLSARFRLFLGGVSKSESVRDLIGCDYEYLWQHLERSFQPGMTRANYGKVWHVDHFKPCAEFDPRIKSHRQACWHFSNLQPLPVLENISKGDKWSRKQEVEFMRRYKMAVADYAQNLAESGGK